ncbi:MAG: hypothetical protein ACW992_03850 [Candidatus Thorarchaeota archaeon]
MGPGQSLAKDQLCGSKRYGPHGYRAGAVEKEKMAKCPVCGMMGKPNIKSVYKEKTYYFMSPQHKEMFDADPEKFNLEVGVDE